MSNRGSPCGQDGQRIALALGSNLGDRRATLRDAWQAILEVIDLPENTIAVASSLYETSPVGTSTPQPDFLNVVMGMVTLLEPLELLDRLQSIEYQFGRRRPRPFQPRTLDIDILLIGDQIIDDPKLTVPHPRLHQRRFVLEPLAETYPRWLHPRRQRNVVEMLADLGLASVCNRWIAGSTAANRRHIGPSVRRLSGPEWVSQSTPDLAISTVRQRRIRKRL